jgi:hypothetical protein
MLEKAKWLDSLGVTLSERGMRQLSAASNKPASSPGYGACENMPGSAWLK